MTATTEDDFLVQLGMDTNTYTCKYCALQWHLTESPHIMYHPECSVKL